MNEQEQREQEPHNEYIRGYMAALADERKRIEKVLRDKQANEDFHYRRAMNPGGGWLHAERVLRLIYE
jgi:hypothetical protein